MPLGIAAGGRAVGSIDTDPTTRGAVLPTEDTAARLVRAHSLRRKNTSASALGARLHAAEYRVVPALSRYATPNGCVLMPIPNDTYPLLAPPSLFQSARLVLITRDGPVIPKRRPKRIDSGTLVYRLAASNSRLRCAVNLAIACLRTGRDKEALDTLEAV